MRHEIALIRRSKGTPHSPAFWQHRVAACGVAPAPALARQLIEELLGHLEKVVDLVEEEEAEEGRWEEERRGEERRGEEMSGGGHLLERPANAPPLAGSGAGLGSNRQRDVQGLA